MYVSSNLMKKRGAKCLGKVATQPALLEKKMNSILRFSPSICDLFLSAPLIGFKLLILKNFNLNPRFQRIFPFGPWFWIYAI